MKTSAITLQCATAALATMAHAQKPQDTPLSLRQETFEKAWRTVKDGFYDPKLKGVDWKAAHDRYAPRIDGVKSDQQFYALLREMLGELHESHLAVFPPWSYLDQDPAPATSHPASAVPGPRPVAARPLATDEAGDVGMEVEVVEGSEVVTKVDPGSAAAVAGVKPGYVLLQIGDVDLRECSRGLDANHKGSARHDVALNDETAALLAGWAGNRLTLKVLDEKDEVRTVALTLQRPNGTPCHLKGLPTEYAVFDSKLLPGSVGYVHFNTFEPALFESISFAMAAFGSEKAMIIDLRGNTGGDPDVYLAIAGRLVKQDTDMGRDVGRNGVEKEVAHPLEPRFDGPVAILIDQRTACAAEILAASLQEAGRMVVVGQRSCGVCESGAVEKLPDNSRLEYPSSIYRTASGKVIEGVGVKPDVEVALTRKDLLAGKDPILEAAIRAVLKRAK